jgi:hypothetical protein
MDPDYRSPDINKICNERDSVGGGGGRGSGCVERKNRI